MLLHMMLHCVHKDPLLVHPGCHPGDVMDLGSEDLGDLGSEDPGIPDGMDVRWCMHYW
jgi:hypothetical protein